MDARPTASPPELIAPPSWRCIDFISDLHLHEGLPRTTEALSRYLDTTPADAIFILGDLFEAWVGDDMRHEPHEARCASMLKQASNRLWMGIMVGNRDFLLGPAFLNEVGAHALPDPTVLHAFGQRALLIHGDELCLADTTYLTFRTQVRQAAWQRNFLAAPLTARLQQARQMREASQAHQRAGVAPEGYADVDSAAAEAWMQAARCDLLIHGHTHRPCSEAFGGGVRHVLSDWDLDHGVNRAEVLRWQADGFNRVQLR